MLKNFEKSLSLSFKKKNFFRIFFRFFFTNLEEISLKIFFAKIFKIRDVDKIPKLAMKFKNKELQQFFQQNLKEKNFLKFSFQKITQKFYKF